VPIPRPVKIRGTTGVYFFQKYESPSCRRNVNARCRRADVIPVVVRVTIRIAALPARTVINAVPLTPARRHFKGPSPPATDAADNSASADSQHPLLLVRVTFAERRSKAAFLAGKNLRNCFPDGSCARRFGDRN